MNARTRRRLGAFMLVAALTCAACSRVPNPPNVVGEDYPGTCMPGEFAWPSDFIESLPGEPSAVGGSVVGLRLEYVNGEWAWRLRSSGVKTDVFGERVTDPAFGKESLVDARTLEVIASHSVELTGAEQDMDGTSAYTAAQESGEQWPSPLIIEMVRVENDGGPAWRLTMCDTATNEHTVMILD